MMRVRRKMNMLSFEEQKERILSGQMYNDLTEELVEASMPILTA